MEIRQLYPAQTGTQSFGGFRVNVISFRDNKPIPGAKVTISITGQPITVEQQTTDDIGRTEEIELVAPAIDYSMEPSETQPYSEYTVLVEAPGYIPVQVTGAQVLPEVTALQPITMDPAPENAQDEEGFVIPPHRLFGDFPPKIAEDEIKDVRETGEIVLTRPVVPEFVVVHDGPPTDPTAQNHYVRYRDYIKNVASSEVYATWPENAIRANVLAIMSFTLNRVYTEWYRNKGYDFTITSSTAFDHKWIPERNYFDTISLIVDEVFANYLSRPNVRQPILTQYCDGRRVTCPDWLSQWGSMSLGDQGYSTIDILRHYYGDDMYINIAPEVSGVPSSWPGYLLDIGASGDKVRQIQEQLNVIAGAYPAIPKIGVDGVYGPSTAGAVERFQSVFGLPQTGVVDYRTWYKISEIYVAVSRIAELT